MRLKHRYIAAQVLYNAASKGKNSPSLTARDIVTAFREKVISLFGEIGAGEFANHANIRYFDNEGLSIFVLRVSRDAEVDAWFTLTCMTAIKLFNVTIRILNVASTSGNCMKDCKIIYENAKKVASDTSRVRLEQSLAELDSTEL